jgi:hypothetical protein
LLGGIFFIPLAIASALLLTLLLFILLLGDTMKNSLQHFFVLGWLSLGIQTKKTIFERSVKTLEQQTAFYNGLAVSQFEVKNMPS